MLQVKGRRLLGIRIIEPYAIGYSEVISFLFDWQPVPPYRLAALPFNFLLFFFRTTKKFSNTNHEYQKKHSLLNSAQVMRITGSVAHKDEKLKAIERSLSRIMSFG
jgi:hypothetical protein